MSKSTGNLKSNITELKKILAEAVEFFEAIEKGVKELDESNAELESELKMRESKIEELEEESEDSEGDSIIECGIGDIKYFEPSNILLQDVMENLESAIKKHTPKKVNQILESIV